MAWLTTSAHARWLEDETDRLLEFGRASVVTPAGKHTTEEQWARELNVAYTPTIVFFDAAGNEVFRLDGYLRPD